VSEARAEILKVPFPWFGGKSRCAALVWERFGDVPNYVEPFFGSGAVLLGRPTPPRTETVNDLDCYVANFWRALARDPEGLARWADWPVNEADLHARHQWLHGQEAFRERMHTEADHFDVRIAGWWVWGISAWIGDNWCRTTTQSAMPNTFRGKGIHRKVPDLGPRKGVHRKRPNVSSGFGSGTGVHRRGPGIHRERPQLGWNNGVHAGESAGRLVVYFEALAARLRRVRVCCGDWTRVLTKTPTTYIGLTGVFLDPPYGDARADTVYNHHDRAVAAKVAAWAKEHGDDPKMRIAVCGYEGEHEFPDGWECVAWTAAGGYARPGTPGEGNRHRERVWFSPHCLKPAAAGDLWDAVGG
jgi:hypothetical protein